MQKKIKLIILFSIITAITFSIQGICSAASFQRAPQESKVVDSKAEKLISVVSKAEVSNTEQSNTVKNNTLEIMASAANYENVTSFTNADISTNNISILFIMDKSMQNSKLPEFYDLLQPENRKVKIESCFTDDLNELAGNSDVITKISSASKIFVVGVPMKTDKSSSSEDWLNYPALQDLRKHAGSADWYYVYTLNSTSSFDWFNLWCNHKEINQLSSTFPWLAMYSSDLFDKTKDLGLKSGAEKPTVIAGYGLAVYMQYVLNQNSCAGISISDLLNKMNITDVSSDTNQKCEAARKIITKEVPLNSNPISAKTIEINKKESMKASNVYKEKHYSVFKDMYIGDSGIWTLNQEPDGDPAGYYGGFGGHLNERIWDGSKWVHHDYKLSQSKEDKAASQDHLTTIEKDSSGNYYIGKTVNDRYYIAKYDVKRKLIKKICINDLTRSSCNKFYLLKKDQLLVQTFLPADQYSAEINMGHTGPARYDKLMLVSMKTGKIIRKYDTGSNYGNIEIRNEKIYLINVEGDKLLIINCNSGKVERLISAKDFPVINEVNNYSEKLLIVNGNTLEEVNEDDYADIMDLDKGYYYSVYKNYIYLLKKSGIYRINTDDGSWSKIISGDNYNYFSTKRMRSTDFIVKNDKEMYILAVNYDEECSTDFYKYYTNSSK